MNFKKHIRYFIIVALQVSFSAISINAKSIIINSDHLNEYKTGRTSNLSGTKNTQSFNKNLSLNSTTDGDDVTALTSWVSGTTNTKVSGSNRLMTVLVMGESTSDFSATGVTYGGQTMTKETDRLYYVGGNRSYAAIFTLDESGVDAAASGTISVTWSSTPNSGSAIYSVLLSNVDQTTPVSVSAENALTGTSVSTSALSASSGDMVIMCGTIENDNTITFNNGFTKVFETNTSWGDGTGGYKMGSGVNETPSYDQSVDDRMVICAIVAKKANTNGDVAALTSWVSGTTNNKVNGSNRLMTVLVMGESTSDFSATGVTYGGQTMTKETDRLYYVSGNRSYAAIFTLNESGVDAATSGTISITWSSTPSSGNAIYSVLLCNVDQTTSVSASAENALTGTSVSTSTLSASSGDMVIMCGTTENDNTITFNNGFTKVFETNTSWGDGTGGYKMGSGVNETPSYDQSGDDRMIISAIVAKKASAGPLPVELITFSANLTEDKILLEWQTATEVNNYGFEIERTNFNSNEERDLEWEKIGFLQGHGNSSSPKSYEFVDENPPSGNLQYRLKQIDTDGTFEYYNTIAQVNNGITDIEDPSTDVPAEFSLSQNYPNPFNPTTTIEYTIPASDAGVGHDLSEVKLIIYDLLGNEVATLVDEHKSPGNYKINFDANNLSSGTYFYKITVDGFQQSKKMILLK